MASILDAINAAAAQLQGEKKEQPKAAQKSAPKSATKSAGSTAGKAAPKSAPKTDSPRTRGGAKYVIPASFKQAIEGYLKGRADMADKLKQKGKSIDGCCDYIFDVMRRRAEKERVGQSAVGMYAEPDEIFGLAVHYYDESEESLKKEK